VDSITRAASGAVLCSSLAPAVWTLSLLWGFFVCVCVLRLFSCDLRLLWGVVRHLELDEMKCY
jgi:hypothetical protein